WFSHISDSACSDLIFHSDQGSDCRTPALPPDGRTPVGCLRVSDPGGAGAQLGNGVCMHSHSFGLRSPHTDRITCGAAKPRFGKTRSPNRRASSGATHI